MLAVANTSAFILGCIFFALASLHIYWGLGGKWGIQSVFPEIIKGNKKLYPGIISFLIVIIGLSGMSFYSFSRSGIFSFDFFLLLNNYGMIAIAIIFLLRSIGEFRYVGIFKKVKGTLFADKDNKYYTPLCLFISLMAILNQLGR